METPPIRDRRDFGPGTKKIEYIAPEEVAAAIKAVVRLAHGIDRRELRKQVLDLLGFDRATEDLTSTILRNLDNLLRTQVLAYCASQVVLAES